MKTNHRYPTKTVRISIKNMAVGSCSEVVSVSPPNGEEILRHPLTVQIENQIFAEGVGCFTESIDVRCPVFLFKY